MPRTVLLLAGPPSGPALWTAVRDRLGAAHDTRVVDALAGDTDGPRTTRAAARVDALRREIAETSAAVADGVAVVAHGLAVPLALAATPDEVPLVLCNGPVRAGRPAQRLLGALAGALVPAAPALLHPALSIRFLASSAGLRRAVRNPYVMDHDTVVTVCGPAFATASDRRDVARFLADLPHTPCSTAPRRGPTLALWGDEDVLHPASTVDEARLVAPGLVHRVVAGGRLMHPVERPWETADAISTWLAAIDDPPPAG